MTVTLLLPPRHCYADQPLPADLGRWLGRGDFLPPAASGGRAQLLRHVDVLPRGWPIAALTRELDAADAGSGSWLRADPVEVAADLTAVRLLRWGELGLDAAEVDALIRPLKTLFGDEGMPISAPVPQRWYLSAGEHARLPPFADPEDVLGDEIHDHLPGGDDGRRWRRLLNEAQIILHNHPVNAARAGRGMPIVNSLWFWGGGRLPDRVRIESGLIATDEVTLAAFVHAAGGEAAPLPPGWRQPFPAGLFDLRAVRSLATLAADWLLPAIEAVMRAEIEALHLDFGDGTLAAFERRHRWRLWRRPRGLSD